MTAREFLDFLSRIEKLKCNTRHSWTSDGRRESVAEHSFRLCVMAMLLEDEEEFKDLDINKVLRMCLIHDFGEAVTGDIPAFIKTEEDTREEEKAVDRLIGTLPVSERTRFAALFEEMDALETEEAKLYRFLDRAEAVIQHNEADLSTWLPLEYDLQKSYGTEEAEAFEWTKELRKEMLRDTERKTGEK